MAYAFTQDLPSTKDMYLAISREVGDQPPKGMIMHLAFEIESGMRIVDVWETEADFDRFAERLRPILDKVLQAAGVSREQMGEPDTQDMTPVEIFVPSIGKRLF
ncbi:MAG: hypothetical protein DLM50_03670 [Candidatus Meridianibacter frigidus]|nr:MAG: hypothetical protein DLM50_03670 [Candidatus Eremiobacteraeota bacterium]